MTRAFAPILLGFTIWSLAFVGLYGLQGLGCASDWPPFFHRSVLIAAYAVTLIALAGAAVWQARKQRGSLAQRTGLLLTLSALVASAIIFAPVLFSSLCI